MSELSQLQRFGKIVWNVEFIPFDGAHPQSGLFAECREPRRQKKPPRHRLEGRAFFDGWVTM